MIRSGQSLDSIIRSAIRLKQVRKNSLRFGDLVVINTQNSVYNVRVLERDSYLVSGGWFDKKGLSPMRTTIAGCTWGGSVIKLDVVAACGLCLEFGNRVITSPIQKMYVIPSAGEN